MPPRRPHPGQQSLFPEDEPSNRQEPETDSDPPSRAPGRVPGRAPWRPAPFDDLPDVRDGLTRKERIVLYTLHELQKERPGRYVATAQLYGRVVERINMSVEELQRILQRMVGVEGGQSVPRPSPFSGYLPDSEDGGDESD